MFTTCLLFHKSDRCVHEVLWVEGGVVFPLLSLHPVIYWATGHGLISHYLIFSLFSRVCALSLCIVLSLLLYLTLPRTHSLPRSKKRKTFIRVWKPPSFGFSSFILCSSVWLSLVLSFSLFHPLSSSFHTRHSAMSHLLICIQHLSSVGYFLSANLIFLYKSLPHHLYGPLWKLETCHSLPNKHNWKMSIKWPVQLYY